jgi:hypothetical protein
MSLTIVNGYACRDCADIAKAKRGENPHPGPADAAGGSGKVAKPGDVKPGETKPGDVNRGGVNASNQDDAVSFGGSLAGLRGDASPKATPVGRAVDLLA